MLKQCSSLAAAGYKVFLVVADGNGDEVRNGVTILDAGRPSGRLDRMLRCAWLVYQRALSVKASIYHLHDPELLPLGLRLKSRGKTVVFDSHEDVPQDVLTKEYLPLVCRKGIAALAASFERYSASRLDGVVAATSVIRDKFKQINPRTIDVNNFPLLGELASADRDGSCERRHVAYVGGVANQRGFREVVQAMALSRSGVRLQLAGRFSEPAFERRVKSEPGWSRVDELGFLDRAGVAALLQRSAAGLVTFHAVPNHVHAQPNKMFEYMSAGVPVIASNFPLWREIIEGGKCGICVDPLKPQEIAEAIDYLASHPAEGEQMGRNWRMAVIERYNWSIEERKLLAFYQKVLEA